MDQIKTRSLPITSEKVISILSQHNPWNGKILDLGCGEGYLSAMVGEKIIAHGFESIDEHLFACDLFPDEFKYDKITCDSCNFNQPFPYKNNTFDAVCSVEVVEHLENIFQFARELYRILKPGGVAIITTPNVMNLNSRLKAFATGFPILCDPLPLSSDNPQDSHIHPISFYFLAYSFKKAGFREVTMHTDKMKRSARLLALAFYIPIKLAEKVLFNRMKKKAKDIYAENHGLLASINTLPMLLGRTAILELTK